jgi:hypothetical protein
MEREAEKKKAAGGLLNQANDGGAKVVFRVRHKCKYWHLSEGAHAITKDGEFL